MSVTDRLRAAAGRTPWSFGLIALPVVGLGAAAIAAAAVPTEDSQVAGLLKARLPKTEISAVNCAKVAGLCEVTAGANLFYVDRGARYLVIGRVYDMETRQDVTAARLLEMNPDMLVGGAAKANATAALGGEEARQGASEHRDPVVLPVLRRDRRQDAGVIVSRRELLALDGAERHGQRGRDADDP